MQAYGATITLAYHGLEFRSADGQIREDRQFTDLDCQLLADWAAKHQKLARNRNSPDALLSLGQQIFNWLNGPAKFLSRLIDSVPPPLQVLFVTGKEESPTARCFLDAPWELVADRGRYWALRDDALFSPVRLIGRATQPPEPSLSRLSMVFMAAAPRGADNLQYEAEERSILMATRDLGLDLVVEESGELELLSACVAREKPHVVQISCHGTLSPEPALLLEDDVGERALVRTSQLVSKLASHQPRLIFLSACETAEADPVLDSLARSLVRSGAPAVLGWAAPVLDNEAALFATYLYQRITAGEDLARSVTYARLDLDHSEKLARAIQNGHRSWDWHLARLYLSSGGGGALATASGPRRFVGSGRAIKTFLDSKNQQIPVAGELEFVGRRREIQTILREFRVPASQRHPGVLIHGLGRQGKSSLAARVAQRLEHSHETIVIYGRYDASAILAGFLDRLGTPEVAAIVSRHLPHCEQDPRHLFPALTELLEGPCEQQRKGANDRTTSRPVLLIIDDFEQALEESDSALHNLKRDFIEPVRAVIRAFNEATTDSRLLITSRFQFTLSHGAVDLAQRLFHLPLHGMDAHEARKQAVAKLHFETARPQRRAGIVFALHQADRIATVGQGSPGLQNLLFSVCLEDPAAGEECLLQMEKFQHSHSLPSEERIRKFFENLAIERLIALLSPGQKELLRRATLFSIPVPLSVFQLFAESGSGPANGSVARLAALGLCEVYDDSFRPEDRALSINAIVRPFAGTLSELEGKELAATVTDELFQRWGGESGGRERNHSQDHELLRLALLAPEPSVVAATGADALRGLNQRFLYPNAGALAKEIMSLLDRHNFPASIDLLRTAAEACLQIGDVHEGATLLKRALAKIRQVEEENVTVDAHDHAATLLSYARTLVNQGQPDRAVTFLERARSLLPPGREQSVVLGDIARIRADKGEVDAALQLHQERLEIFEALGDKRERAVTLGDIARIRAAKGEVDAALQLHQERLEIFEALGDKRERAVTLGDIARIRAAKGEVDAALQLHQDMMEIFEALGDKRSRAVTLGDIARIRAAKGEVDAALQLHQERLKVYEALGDKRSRAVTLGDIARIRAAKGEVDAALQLHQDMMEIFEALGDKRSRAVTLGDIARIRADKGEVDAALQLHQERLEIFEALGDKRERAVTLGDIARIRAAKGEVDAALQLHQDMMEIFEALGDKRERAVTLGDIARIRAAKGEVDAALQLHQDMMEIFEALGDKRERAVTLGDIARIRAAKGEVDAALQLHQEELKVYEALGDKRSRAVTLGDIARIRAAKGEVDAALQLHQERLEIFEALGDKRERAVTLGDIARIRAAKGEVDAALQLHQERLKVYEALGDKDGMANALWSMATIELTQHEFARAAQNLVKSYQMILQLGRLDGICVIGLDLGRLLCYAGQVDEASAVLTRSRDGFLKLGRAEMAQRAEALLQECAAQSS